MEFFTGNIKIRDIFLHNGNWWKFFQEKKEQLRSAIPENVIKMLICRTIFYGFHLFECPTCKNTKKAPHSCKSKFCSSCGKKATDIWIKKSFDTLPQTTWQHITFTMPDLLWELFWFNRHLINKIPSLAANIIKDEAGKQGFIPGIFLAIHTSGRDLKRNMHLHLSTTIGGLTINRKKWKKKGYFHHGTIKSQWRYKIITLFREQYKAGNLILPPKLNHLKDYTAFNSWLNFIYQKKWVVHFSKHNNNVRHNVEYLGKYLKRPPLGETRIKKYDGKNVTFEFLDHYTKKSQTLTLPVLEFIGRIVTHIHDKYFRTIRYYGFLANRNRGKLLPHVMNLLEKVNEGIAVKFKNHVKESSITWRGLIIKSFNRDPLQCRKCKTQMNLLDIRLPLKVSIHAIHQKIAHGYFPLLCK